MELSSLIEEHFCGCTRPVRGNIALLSDCMIKAPYINIAELCRQLGLRNCKKFNTNEKRILNFLDSAHFQIDDSMWRKYIQMLLGMLSKLDKSVSSQGHRQEFMINVDYTTDRDDFLILYAALQFENQSIPLYFSMRRYPKRTGMIDQKKLEEAFFKALGHILPKIHDYIIIADRGFGHERIINVLEQNNFRYVLRCNENLNINHPHSDVKNAKELPHRSVTLCDAQITSWNKRVSLVKAVSGDNSWILLSNLEERQLCDAAKIYEKRFSIEKMFQNHKSGGFEIEKIKVKFYHRFKKLLFLMCIAYSTMVVAAMAFKRKNSEILQIFAPDKSKAASIFL